MALPVATEPDSLAEGIPRGPATDAHGFVNPWRFGLRSGSRTLASRPGSLRHPRTAWIYKEPAALVLAGLVCPVVESPYIGSLSIDEW